MHRRRVLIASSLLLFAPAVRAAELFHDDTWREGRPSGSGNREELRRMLAANRERQIRRVHAYAARGRFPRNTEFPGERLPHFLDDRGVPCAVAHLMIEDGRRADVERIARENNLVRVVDVQSGPLLEWVLGSGLLQEEAARIQPAYDFMDRPRPVETPVAPHIVERERIRRHLRAVEQELRRDTAASLAIALERLERARARAGA